ncbi:MULTISPECIES: hypothetical protein [Virgibacillus]|uniref:Uncharacterized protein n=2 Tax=Virgibacillus TaxID=84406 RepID=A0A024QGA5_9BACI|nr:MULTISPECIES: hypothetical protein [Virgibacillus]EQB34721.1 hypothetical protein M948_20245 [Virgibacillus sp. CM-4]MYL43633.1 hypothetical protein [Virgibacillus massiliensis]GGJ63076.1 hypothetical protein GCM10007111_26460 [Virgibacillus kapii]CDQ41578.1 hypothetical protein BN990_03951 [Virgibacillus massiliensis]
MENDYVITKMFENKKRQLKEINFNAWKSEKIPKNKNRLKLSERKFWQNGEIKNVCCANCC